MTAEDIVRFWQLAGPARWFTRDAAFDGELAVRYREVLAQARSGLRDGWAASPEGALGLVIVLDQFSRNIHRGSPLAFAADSRALALASSVVAKGWHQVMPAPLAIWFLMPFEHAEDLDAQHRAVGLFQSLGLEEMVFYAKLHLDIIRRFGRFPHRNPILGRKSTPAELAFLAGGGFAG
ncbi:MAG: DUF924 domain-containing protein [Pseudomonadota bacterium]|nr:DUF924 domain-containing protein [Pseudomonadota bacterium]